MIKRFARWILAEEHDALVTKAKHNAYALELAVKWIDTLRDGKSYSGAVYNYERSIIDGGGK